jgi:ParB family chromosome partitioning protein
MGTKGIVSIELSKIVTGDFNPRKSINESELRELANSIKQVGILQPVLVRPKGRKFEIVCGERRFRASVLADTKTFTINPPA